MNRIRFDWHDRIKLERNVTDSNMITHDVLRSMNCFGSGVATMWSWKLGELCVTGMHPNEPHQGNLLCRNIPKKGRWNRGIFDLPKIHTVGQLKRRIEDLGIVAGSRRYDSASIPISRESLESLGFFGDSHVMMRKTPLEGFVAVDLSTKPMRVGIKNDDVEIWIADVYFMIEIERILADFNMPPKGNDD